MKDRILLIDGRKCHVFDMEHSDSYMVCGMEEHIPNEILNTAELFYKSDVADRCCLIIFETTDWNGDFSPWAAEPVFGDVTFTGKASDTLIWVTNLMIPQLMSLGIIHEGETKYIAGYSLSGLYALWAFLESDLFDGAASCSGSLWFPGWMDYLKNHDSCHDGIVYLSLGSKEERTKNMLMSTVGDNTRNSYNILKAREHIKRSTLEWNKGGHFAEPTERLIKGMHWLLKNGR